MHCQIKTCSYRFSKTTIAHVTSWNLSYYIYFFTSEVRNPKLNNFIQLVKRNNILIYWLYSPTNHHNLIASKIQLRCFISQILRSKIQLFHSCLFWLIHAHIIYIIYYTLPCNAHKKRELKLVFMLISTIYKHKYCLE